VQAISSVVVSLARIGDLSVVVCIKRPAILAALDVDQKIHWSIPLSNVEFQRHLFEYRYGGSEWGIEINAESQEDAQQRLKALAWAHYKGRVVATIPLPNSLLSSLSRLISAAFQLWPKRN
jgi:hypothetical protein